MADINAIAKQFTDFYYTTFDSNRANLRLSMYRDTSMLTFEGTPIQGSASIIEKLTSLPFTKVVHKVVTLDAQPSNPSAASLIVSVTGLLLVDDGANPLQFSQVFQLIPDGASYYVLNDIFRLNYGA
ncbi:nuclear transport factor 2 [Lactarius quietus]|nr:nuclear transport factor 2 [Lactarius quietus]